MLRLIRGRRPRMFIPMNPGLPGNTIEYRSYKVRTYGGVCHANGTSILMYWNREEAVHEAFFEDLVRAQLAGLVRRMIWGEMNLSITFKCPIHIGAYVVDSVFFLY